MATGEAALFFQLFMESDERCENLDCRVPLLFSTAQFHHLKTKGAHPGLRLEPKNIVIICFSCHNLAHQKGNQALKLPKQYEPYL